MGWRFALRAAPAHAPCGMFSRLNPGLRCVDVAVTLAGRFWRAAGSVAMGHGSRLALRVTG